MLRIIIGLSIGLLLFTSCEEERMENRALYPERWITLDDLKANGYERIWGVDVMLYGKMVNDTAISYQFDSNISIDDDGNIKEDINTGYPYYGYPYWMNWQIKLNSLDKKEVEVLIEKLDCEIVLSNEEKNYFELKSYQHNTKLKARLDKDSTLNVSCTFDFGEIRFDDDEEYVPDDID